jgi:hypothetical protein
MMRNTKKLNLILGLLLIAFFVISASLIFDMLPVTTKPKPPIIKIEGHRDAPITHGQPGEAVGCADCHYAAVYGECTDSVCHPSPDYMIGDNNTIYFAHHDLSYSGFMDCWSSDCHDPGTVEDPLDVRYVKGDLVEGDTWQEWHLYCETCHPNVHSTPP